ATGKPAFRGDNPMAALHAVQEHQPPPPRSRRPEIPEDLEQLIVQLLTKDRAGRPASAAEVARRLQPVGGAPATAIQDAATLSLGPSVVPWPARRRRLRALTTAGVLAVLLLSAAVYVVLPRRDAAP